MHADADAPSATVRCRDARVSRFQCPSPPPRPPADQFFTRQAGKKRRQTCKVIHVDSFQALCQLRDMSSSSLFEGFTITTALGSASGEDQGVPCASSVEAGRRECIARRPRCWRWAGHLLRQQLVSIHSPEYQLIGVCRILYLTIGRCKGVQYSVVSASSPRMRDGLDFASKYSYITNLTLKGTATLRGRSAREAAVSTRRGRRGGFQT